MATCTAAFESEFVSSSEVNTSLDEVIFVPETLSTSLQIFAIALTTSIGFSPIEVSADNITASVPSSIAFVMSETSALVGLCEEIIEVNISVAVIVIFPCKFVSFNISF